MAGTDDGGEARGAEPVDGDAADRVGQAREQRREARHVAVVLAGLVRAAEPDVLDLGGVDAGALDGGGDRERGEVVRAHGGEPAAVAADRRPHRREDDRSASHRALSANQRSTCSAHWRPSLIAQTISDCPRRASPAAKTPSTEVA